MFHRKSLFLLVICILFPVVSFGAPEISISYGGGHQVDRHFDKLDQVNHLKGIAVKFLQWGNSDDFVNLSMNTSLTYLWTEEKVENRPSSTTNYALYPELDFNVIRSAPLNMYFMLSAGPSYLTRRYLANREQGSHFTFQDYVGVGLKFGQSKRIGVSLRYQHYSNASFSSPNQSFDFPLVGSISYQI